MAGSQKKLEPNRPQSGKHNEMKPNSCRPDFDLESLFEGYFKCNKPQKGNQGILIPRG